MNKINHIRDQINTYYANKREEHNKKKSKSNNRKYGVYYQSSKWKHLRAIKFVNNPCCEVCERQGIVKPTEEIHHLHVFLSGKNELDKWTLLLDYNNLCGCCAYHHHLFHDYLRRYNKTECTINDLLSYEERYKEFI